MLYLLGSVLLLVANIPGFVVQRFPVVQLLDLVDADQPMLWRESLLQVLELDVLVADFGVARPIEARRRPEIQLWSQIKVLYFTSVSGKRSAFWFKSEILHFCFHRHVCIYALPVLLLSTGTGLLSAYCTCKNAHISLPRQGFCVFTTTLTVCCPVCCGNTWISPWWDINVSFSFLPPLPPWTVATLQLCQPAESK